MWPKENYNKAKIVTFLYLTSIICHLQDPYWCPVSSEDSAEVLNTTEEDYMETPFTSRFPIKYGLSQITRQAIS